MNVISMFLSMLNVLWEEFFLLCGYVVSKLKSLIFVFINCEFYFLMSYFVFFVIIVSNMLVSINLCYYC